MSNSKVYCCVYGCKSRANKDLVSFHSFPKHGTCSVEINNKNGVIEKVDVRKVWEKNLKCGKTISSSMKVCSKHFEDSDFCLHVEDNRPKKSNLRRNRLKRNAIPTKNLPKGSHETGVNKERRRIKKYDAVQPILNTTCESMKDEQEAANEVHAQEITRTSDEWMAAEALCALAEIKYEDVAVQVNTWKIRTICENIISDKKLNSMTGLNSFKMLDTIESLVLRVKKENFVSSLNIREKIILTFTKLKNDTSYVVLSLLFGNISSQSVKEIFYDMLSVLASVLKPLIYLPPIEEIQRNLPKNFEEFRDVRVILDCTEIFVQRTKCLCCRIKCYSYYKGNNTIKFMTAVTPAGLISFISEAYGGRASDKAIFENSNLLSYLNPDEDAIMVDRGFLIDDICSENRIKLIRPPFMKNRKQLSLQEAEQNLFIARARVHIERVNQRIKIFKILSNVLPWNLVPKVEEIMTICCAVVNMSSPIFSDDRF